MLKLPEILHKAVFIRSLKTSLLVGTILSIINYWELIANLQFGQISVIKIVMNFLVPYLVAAFTIIKTRKK